MSTLETPQPNKEVSLPDYPPTYPPDLEERLNSTNRMIEDADRRKTVALAAGNQAAYSYEDEASAQFQAVRAYELKRYARRQRVGQFLHRMTHLLERRRS